MTSLMLLLGTALAAEPFAWEQTTVMVQPDFGGKPMVPFWETAWAAQSFENTRVEGYGEVAWPGGVDDRLALRLYALDVDGETGKLDWTIGRQKLALPTWPRLMDGARAALNPNADVRIEAWAGWANQPMLPYADGVGFARASAAVDEGDLHAQVGAWTDIDPKTGAVLHPDASVRWEDEANARDPQAGALAVLAIKGNTTVLERARIDLGLRPVSGTRAIAYADHRQVLDPTSPLSAGILDAFAPQGADEAGLGFGYATAKRAELWLAGSADRWDPKASDASPGATTPGKYVGARGEVSWRPNCRAERWCLSPSWRGVAGPGGMFHSVGAVIALPAPTILRLSAHGYVVPWRTTHSPWDTAAVAGLDAGIVPKGNRVVWKVGGEVGRGIVADLDVRGWTSLRLVLR